MLSQSVSVRVGSRYRISLPRMARDRLNIKSGDCLLVDVKDGLLILVPEPKDSADLLADLHKEIWAGLDTAVYLEGKPEAWDEPQDQCRSTQ